MNTKINIIANVVGRVWSALMSFAFVPFYVRFMGVEGYGLIGFFTSMLAVFFVLDMGLSLTLNRELARLEDQGEDRRTARTLVRTMELIYWAISALICLFVIVAAPTIAVRWLNVRNLPIGEAVRAVQLMGLVAMFRWPVALYTGALMGLRRQVTLNVVTSVAATVQGGGAVLVLWLISPTPTAFFTWQAISAGLQVAVLVRMTWHHLPLAHHRPRFGRTELRAIAGFSAGITGITLLSAVISQLDKFMLSKLLPLEQFGYYSLAGSIASLLIPAAGAVYAAVFPVFSTLVASDRHEELRVLYHKSCQMLSVMIVPAAITIAFFSTELLTVYFHDARIVRGVSLLLTLQIVGNGFLALIMLPVGLQFAFGWTKLSFYKNVVAVVLYVPALLAMVSRFGAPGAAGVWIMVTGGYFLIEIQVMHTRLLRGDQWRWYFIDVGIPAAVSLSLAIAAKLLMPLATTILAKIVLIVVAGGLMVIGSALFLPGTRAFVTSLMAIWRGRLFRSARAIDLGPIG